MIIGVLQYEVVKNRFITQFHYSVCEISHTTQPFESYEGILYRNNVKEHMKNMHKKVKENIKEILLQANFQVMFLALQ